MTTAYGCGAGRERRRATHTLESTVKAPIDYPSVVRDLERWAGDAHDQHARPGRIDWTLLQYCGCDIGKIHKHAVAMGKSRIARLAQPAARRQARKIAAAGRFDWWNAS